jgi:histidyl-tRNA synthetase
VKKLQAPRGTFDVLPPDGRRRLGLVALTDEVLARAGYEPIETPVFEDTELFARGVGESTDIVQKEMFTFEDKAGRSLTLRPEATAGICRAYIEHGMHKLPQPVKVWEAGPFFRHEAPQAGRFRQFLQIDAEAIGSDDPSLDAELILLLDEILERAGTGPRRLRLSSLGTPETRAEYIEELKGFLRAREAELSEEVRSRLDQNPLRAFDADHPGTQAVMKEAPLLLDRLAPEDAEHFAEVRGLLDAEGLTYEIDPTLVRGLDYYTRTVFEFTSDALGAQSGVGGGGRYDGLVEQLGGPPTPGCGWAAGVERIRLAATAPPTAAPPVDLYVALTEPAAREAAFGVTAEARRALLATHQELAGRSLKGQLKHADRLRARYVAVVAPEGSATLRDLAAGTEEELSAGDVVVRILRERGMG